jgi:eukaryotic-like serine/threonine-protein kinase
MSVAPTLPVPVGELVAGKYRVERELGHGGMGVVVAAMHEQLRQRVAIKMLLSEAKASPNALARFLREARAAATIKGEHVARVLDVGELEAGSPYIVMEYLEGRDLAAILASLPEPRRLPAEEAVGYVLQACEAIAEAHAAGIVHRDLKPSNLFLSRRPDGTPMVKVLDFGISKALLAGVGEGTLTTTSSFVGSPIYAPPEQLVAAHEVDARADIWALGTILYEALAGRPPYVGDSVMHVASRIFNEPPTPLDEVRSGLPPPLVSAVMRCLEKKPEDRFQDVRGLAEALAPFAPEAAISAERVARIVAASTPVSGPSPLRGSQSGAASSLVATTRPSSMRAWVVAGVAVAGVVVGFIVFSGRSHSVRPPATSQSVAAAVSPPVAPSAADLALPAPSSSEKASLESPEAGAVSPQPSTGSPARSPATAAPRKNPLSVVVK